MESIKKDYQIRFNDLLNDNLVRYGCINDNGKVNKELGRIILYYTRHEMNQMMHNHTHGISEEY